MAESILTPLASPYDIASAIETEAGKLKSGIELMYGALQFQYGDKESAGRAQGQLFFLADVLNDLQKRLDGLSTAAYDIARTETSAEVAA